MNDDELAKSLALLPDWIAQDIQKNLDEEWPGEFEVIRNPDGGIAVVQKESIEE